MNAILSNENGNGGIGVLGLLGVLFVGLKLTGYVTWSWAVVTMPFWGGFLLALALFGLIVITSVLADR